MYMCAIRVYKNEKYSSKNGNKSTENTLYMSEKNDG